MTITVDRRQVEAALAARDFKHFLEYVRLLEPPPGQALIPFAFWDHLAAVTDLLLTRRLVAILKARQIGVSWLLAAYTLWVVLYHEGAVALLISKGQNEAGDLLDKVKFIHQQLPQWLQKRVGVSSGQELSFPDMHSKITALPSTENAGRSEAATLVVQDEADFHEHLDSNYAAIKPTVDAGGQLIMASTANKRRLTSLFKQVYRGAAAWPNGRASDD